MNTHGVLSSHARRVAGVIALTVCAASRSHAQVASRDTVYLDDLQRAAERVDPRAAQIAVNATQSALRKQNLRAERLPTATSITSAQYQSDVARVGAVLPGVSIPSVPNDQYDTYLSIRAPLFDPSRTPRQQLEDAQLSETQARVRTTLWQLRSAVSEVFFGLQLRDAQMAAIDVAINDLKARRAVATTRVNAGTALPSEQLLLDAEIARRQQSRDELETDRDALRRILGSYTGRTVAPNTVLRLRSAASFLAEGLPGSDTIRARPEFSQFDQSRALIDARKKATLSQDLPRISAFTRTGYGRPGLNPLGQRFDTYLVTGLQVEWNVWNWRRTQREAEAQGLQREIIASEERAFRESLQRATIAERARMTSLERALQFDDSIASLRDRILRETRLRYDAGEANTADYVARLSEQLSAALDRETHRVRLAESRARYLTTLGLEVR
jgi:outer membrane protein TolC